MGVCGKLLGMFVMVTMVIAVPTGDKYEPHFSNDDTTDLNEESSEIISEAVAPPKALLEKLQDTEAAATDNKGEHSIELVGDSQTFFPSFANLFESRPNNFRLGFGNEETAYSQRPNSYRSLLNYPLFGNYRNLESNGKQSTPAASAPLVADTSSSVLGSGNFGIIRGGTFSTQNDDEPDYAEGYNYYNNGHGRPSLGYVANPRPNYNQDQFANFRDFADINAPGSSAYSHFVVVYANKNNTQAMDEIGEESKQVAFKPKNIIETLDSLDEVKQPSKVSKSKAKLEATKLKFLNKKEQWKKSNSKYLNQKQDEDTLLALS